MKTIENPSQTTLAAALGVGTAMVTRYKRKGMPLESIEAAQAWRDANVRVRFTREADTAAAGRALVGEQAARQAGALLQAAAELLETGGDVLPMVGPLRQALAAVPPAQRDRVLFPVDVMDLLTEDVARVVKTGDPAGLLRGTLSPGKPSRGTTLDMGTFWYAVAAGEVHIRPPTR